MAHPVRRRSDGTVEIRLSARERDLLRSLPQQLRPILIGEQPVHGVHERLFPPAYEDPDLEHEYRELVGHSLSDERLAAIEAFAATLDEGHVRRGTWTVQLDDDAAHAWLSAVNDARLTLGVVTGITSESQWEEGPDQRNPASVALWYLGWLQEQLLDALMRGLEDADPA